MSLMHAHTYLFADVCMELFKQHFMAYGFNANVTPINIASFLNELNFMR